MLIDSDLNLNCTDEIFQTSISSIFSFIIFFGLTLLFCVSGVFLFIKLLGENSFVMLFQYFLVYLVDIVMNNTHITINATTLETASSIAQISSKNIFKAVRLTRYNQIVLIFIISFARP
jgi:hypothetical protein